MNETELTLEKQYLDKTLKLLNEKIETLEKDIFKNEEDRKSVV